MTGYASQPGYMLPITQQKAALSSTQYYLRDTHPRIWGRAIGFTNVSPHEVRAIVAYSNGQRSWFRLDPVTMRAVYCGNPPPPPPRRH